MQTSARRCAVPKILALQLALKASTNPQGVGWTRNVVAILLGNFVPREQGAESPFSIFDERPQGPPVWPDGTEKW
jgi:hypothetical protein